MPLARMPRWLKPSRNWTACARNWPSWAGDKQSGDGLIVPKGLVPQEGLEYLRKLRDVKYYETIFEILARQYRIGQSSMKRARVRSSRSSIPPLFPTSGRFPSAFTLSSDRSSGDWSSPSLRHLQWPVLSAWKAIRSPRPSCTASIEPSISGRGGTSAVPM